MMSMGAEISAGTFNRDGLPERTTRLFPRVGPGEGLYGDATWGLGHGPPGAPAFPGHGRQRFQDQAPALPRPQELKARVGLTLSPPKAQASIGSRSQLSVQQRRYQDSSGWWGNSRVKIF